MYYTETQHESQRKRKRDEKCKKSANFKALLLDPSNIQKPFHDNDTQHRVHFAQQVLVK